jgi:hypothetical protein
MGLQIGEHGMYLIADLFFSFTRDDMSQGMQEEGEVLYVKQVSSCSGPTATCWYSAHVCLLFR